MEQFVKDNFTLLLTVGIVATVVGVAVSIVYRVASAREVVSLPEQDVLFTERWASGSSQKNLVTKLGGASNCLSITLSRNAVIIRPMFPFNLLFLPEVYDLEHVIPRSSIKNIEFGGPNSRCISLEFESHGGRMKRFELSLRRGEEFRHAIELDTGIQQTLGADSP